jgi:hypothetical protein
MNHQAANTPRLLSWMPVVTLALSSLLWSGCASSAPVQFSQAAVDTNSPSAQVVAPLEAVHLAEAYVRIHPGTDYMIGSGESMMPLYKDHTVIVTQKICMSDLKAGMTVVFIGDSGFPVAHALVKATTDGWIAQGVGNAQCDHTLVSKDNFIGMVVKAYEPTSSPMLALLQNGSSNVLASN